jgi:CcmD family protein
MENLSYLFAAYTAIWIILFAYLLRLQRREEGLRQELEQIRQRLSRERQDIDP